MIWCPKQTPKIGIFLQKCFTILIQLPDRKSNIEEELKNDLIKRLATKYNKTFKNGKLSIK